MSDFCTFYDNFIKELFLNQALVKDAFIEPPAFAAGAAGKNGLQDYLRLGYIPDDGSHSAESVSMTLGIHSLN